MRVATILVVLIIHVALFILFATLRTPLPRSDEEEAPSLAFFLPPDEVDTTAKGAPQPPPPSDSSTVPPAPDWRSEMQIAANTEIEAEERKRHKPSPLAPHDFSRVKPGSTDYSKPQFDWSHSATHRVEEIPNGGLLININDRCAIAWVIFPFPLCKVGKMTAQGDLFQHMKDPPMLGESDLP